MAPADDSHLEGQPPENVFLLPLRGQVIFPGVRSTIEISRSTFKELCDQLDRSGAQGVGCVAVRPLHARRSAAFDASGGDEMYEVGTYCRLVSHDGASDSKGSDSKGVPSLSRKVQVVLDGKYRFKVIRYTQQSPVQAADVQPLTEEDAVNPAISDDVKVRALVESVREKITDLMRNASEQAENGGRNSFAALLSGNKTPTPRLPTSPSALANVVGATLAQLTVEERQHILETVSVLTRLELVLDLLQRESEAKRVSGEISASIQKSRESEMKNAILQRQVQEVRKSLQKLQSKMHRDQQTEEGQDGEEHGENEEEEPEDETARLEERLTKARLPDDAAKIARKELRRLKSLQPHHPEYTSAHTYLELLADLPWRNSSEEPFDLRQARAIMDADHKGLEKVKLRILEFLAVHKIRGHLNGPILCLHGPPGIGKTSLGRSIAKALGRKFHRVALGGVRDEAEIRGHRRTYIGSIPGVIVQAFQSLGVNNPVILLDEIDKMAQNAHFNPQATLLEVLDPEQNGTFKDHYLNTPLDLSKVLFICTANDTSLIDRPLLDRMEVIELSGYTLEEKVAITSSHLLPKQRQLHALEAPPPPLDQIAESVEASATVSLAVPTLEVSEEAIRELIKRWTAESGVRTLERQLAQICRWAALRLQGVDINSIDDAARSDVVEREAELASCGPDEQGRMFVAAKHLQHIVGAELFESEVAERLVAGVATGLSVSQVGGQLMFVEASRSAGHGKLTITGQLGSVMTESVETALSLLRSRFVRANRGLLPQSSNVLDFLHSAKTGAADNEGDRDPFAGEDLHVHFPAGGIPKDGPSAGVAILLALASLLLGRPMRSDTAVTGEVTLRGHVLPVGGIRDKVLAAHRAGIRHVLLPLANKRNVLDEIPPKTLREIEVHYMKSVDEGLDWAFSRGKPGTGGGEQEDVATLVPPADRAPVQMRSKI